MAETAFRNWNFSNISYKNTQYLTHCFHPYPAKFIPQIPHRLIELYSRKKEDKILDPFCGSGTTLVESKLLGRTSIGIDTNPLAVMISKAKVSPISKKQLEKFIAWLDQIQETPEDQQLDVMHFSQHLEWFRADVLGQIETILERIDEIHDFNTRNFIRVGLSSILKGASNARMDRIVPTFPRNPVYKDHKHYDRLVDNDTRKINVFARLSRRLTLMQRRLELFLHSASDARAFVYLGDARNLDRSKSDLLKEGEIKLVITSPPYWSAFNYKKIHQLSIDILSLRRASLDAEIGRGNFLIEMEKVYEQVSKSLASGGVFCLVIGRSKMGINKRLADIGCRYDMQLQEKFARRIKNHSFFVKGIKSEEILVFQKK